MSETVEKVCCVKKAWKYVVTGVACAVVGGLVMIGANTAKIQETITKAQAKNAVIAAAQYSAEQVLSKVTVLGTENAKAEAIKVVMEEVEKSAPKFIEDAKTEKETVSEVKKIEEKKEVKDEAKDIKAEEKVKDDINTVKAEVKKDDVVKKTEEVKTAEATAPKTEVKK